VGRAAGAAVDAVAARLAPGSGAAVGTAPFGGTGAPLESRVCQSGTGWAGTPAKAGALPGATRVTARSTPPPTTSSAAAPTSPARLMRDQRRPAGSWKTKGASSCGGSIAPSAVAVEGGVHGFIPALN